MEKVQTDLQHSQPHRETEHTQRSSITQVAKINQRNPLLKLQTAQNHVDKIKRSLNKDSLFIQNYAQPIIDPLNNNQSFHLNQNRPPTIHNQQINKTKTFQYSAHQNTIKIKPYINHQEHFVNSFHAQSHQVRPLQNYQSVLPISKNTPVYFSSNVNNINSVHNINTINPIQFVQPQIKVYTPLSSSSYNYSQVKPYVFSQPLSSSPAQFNKLHQNEPIDQQFEKPLMNKVKNKYPPKQNKNVSLITQDQIRRGFNNNLKIALEKVNKKQLQQSQYQQINQKPIRPHQIKIVSNLVHESYSPSNSHHQHMNSSEKKGKKRIFQNSKSRDKTRSLYEQSIVSFGTPQSIKMMNNLNNSVFDYQLKTERQQENEIVENKIIVRKNNQLVCEQKQMQIPKQMVPEHILKAWQKLKDKN